MTMTRTARYSGKCNNGTCTFWGNRQPPYWTNPIQPEGVHACFCKLGQRLTAGRAMESRRAYFPKAA